MEKFLAISCGNEDDVKGKIVQTELDEADRQMRDGKAVHKKGG